MKTSKVLKYAPPVCEEAEFCYENAFCVSNETEGTHEGFDNLVDYAW